MVGCFSSPFDNKVWPTKVYRQIRNHKHGSRADSTIALNPPPDSFPPPRWPPVLGAFFLSHPQPRRFMSKRISSFPLIHAVVVIILLVLAVNAAVAITILLVLILACYFQSSNHSVSWRVSPVCFNLKTAVDLHEFRSPRAFRRLEQNLWGSPCGWRWRNPLILRLGLARTGFFTSNWFF